MCTIFLFVLLMNSKFNQLIRGVSVCFLKFSALHFLFNYNNVMVSDVKMVQRYVVVNSVPTHIFTWDKWITENLDELKELVLVMAPSVPEFYVKFCSLLYIELEKKIPIWMIGLAGE
jgi:hypothetical protein